MGTLDPATTDCVPCGEEGFGDLDSRTAIHDLVVAFYRDSDGMTVHLFDTVTSGAGQQTLTVESAATAVCSLMSEKVDSFSPSALVRNHGQ